MNKMWLIEVKNEDHYWKLEPAQIKFYSGWKAEVPILESVEDARAFVTAVRSDTYNEWVRGKLVSLF